jgi:serine/threonine protein phosphatase PrpC
MVIRAFITHKQAELFADCQDRFGVNPDTKSIAVSDGMGSTWQQKIWAQLLVDTYVDSQDWSPSSETIKPLCQSWKTKVLDYIQKLKDTNAPINILYRNERNLVSGRSAGATFVGIRFNGDEWNGSVLGDSCLIEWDGNEAQFNTSQDSGTFDSYPDYFDSDASKEGKGTPKPIGGVLTEGKYLLLVSDPFSEFLLEHSKQGDIAKYVQQLLSLASHDDFETLVCEWRKEGMHNDDTTLVIVEYDNSENLSITHPDNIVEMIEKEKSSQISANQAIENVKTVQENPSHEEVEVVENFVVIQNNEKEFINEFLIEYQRCLQKKFPKQMGKLRYKWTQKAVEEALNILFEKYSVIKK